MRPTCLYADKNLSTETNLQRSRSPATNQDLLGKTNKKCFPRLFSKGLQKCNVLCFHCIISLRLSCAVGHACVIDVFDQMFPFFGGATQTTLTISTMGVGQFPRNNFVPTAVLAQFQHPSHPELVHYLAPAVCQLSLPHLQHHPQSPLMLKIPVRPVKARQKRAEGMESGARKRRSSLFNCGAINTHDLNRGMPSKCGKKSPKKFPKSGR